MKLLYIISFSLLSPLVPPFCDQITPPTLCWKLFKLVKRKFFIHNCCHNITVQIVKLKAPFL